MKTLRQLFKYFKPYLGSIILYVVLGFIIILIGMIVPQFQKTMFDYVFPNKPFEIGDYVLQGSALVAGIVICLISQSLLRQAMHYFRVYIHERMAQSVSNDMRADLFEKLVNQSQHFLRKQNTGELMTILNGDPEVVKNFFIGTLPQMFEVIVSSVFGAIMMITIHPYMLFAAIALMPIVAVLAKRAGKRIGPKVLAVRDLSADLSRRTQENINGIRVVKAFNNENLEREIFNNHNKTVLNSHFDYLREYVRSYLPLNLCSAGPYILINVVAAWLIINDRMTVGGLLAVGGYYGYVTQLFTCVAGWINATQQAINSSNKIVNFLNHGCDMADCADALDISDNKADIKLNNVTFTSDGKTVLKNVSLDIPHGKHLGIMGKTGSGKSILANMLMRFYDPTEGCITLNDIDIRKYKLKQYHGLFAPVSQDVFLFSETVKKNISFYNSSASEESIEHAAKIAQAAGFISELPDKYETIIGERGMGLSGGQKQRISIARAILKQAPVLILDDASSALDMETEQALSAALKQELTESTVITIAHRVASVKNCDEIIYMENGEIAERGTHEQLLELKGRYYQVYTEQYSELISSMKEVK